MPGRGRVSNKLKGELFVVGGPIRRAAVGEGLQGGAVEIDDEQPLILIDCTGAFERQAGHRATSAADHNAWMARPADTRRTLRRRPHPLRKPLRWFRPREGQHRRQGSSRPKSTGSRDAAAGGDVSSEVKTRRSSDGTRLRIASSSCWFLLDPQHSTHATKFA